MEENNPGTAESASLDSTIALSEKERKILDLIMQRWPTSALEIAGHFSEDLSSREQRKKISTRYTYYLQKLIDKNLLHSKRVGNALVVWPPHMEKFRSPPKMPEE